MTSKKTKRPLRASKEVRKAIEELAAPLKTRKKTELKRRTGQLRKKGKPVPVEQLRISPGYPTEFVVESTKKRGRLLRLSFTGATVEYDAYEHPIKYYLGVEEIKRIPREIVVVSAKTVVQELR